MTIHAESGRPQCSICKGKGCEVCFGLGYIEEWPSERLERELKERQEQINRLRQLLMEALDVNEREGHLPLEFQAIVKAAI